MLKYITCTVFFLAISFSASAQTLIATPVDRPPLEAEGVVSSYQPFAGVIVINEQKYSLAQSANDNLRKMMKKRRLGSLKGKTLRYFYNPQSLKIEHISF